MEIINIWAKLSNVTDAQKNPSAPDATALSITISTRDDANIQLVFDETKQSRVSSQGKPSGDI